MAEISSKLLPSLAAGHQAFEQRQYVDAIQSYQTALKQENDLNGLLRLAICYERLNQIPQAYRIYCHALKHYPKSGELHNNAGNLLKRIGRCEQAQKHYQVASELTPHIPEVWSNLGTTYQILGDTASALKLFNRTLERFPEHTPTRLNKALSQLRQGDFQEGWTGYEARHQEEHPAIPVMSGSKWEGQSLSEQRLLLIAEQGFGDTIQFIRYLPQVCERVEQVTVACQPSLIPLFEHQGLPIKWIPISAHYDEALYDVHLPLMSLARVFGTNLDSIPSENSYLSAQPSLISLWKERLASSSLNIGLCADGNQSHAFDAYRSIPIKYFKPFTKLSYARLFNLYKPSKGKKNSGLSYCLNLEADMNSWDDTVAIIENLDLVITVDTAVAHLAGAMGKPTWLLLSTASDWRWLEGRDRSPWYPSMRLFRQQKCGDWQSVMDDVFDALKHLGKADFTER